MKPQESGVLMQRQRCGSYQRCMLVHTQNRMQILTLRLWQYFKVEIIKQELSSIFDLETRLFPCLLDMKTKGVRVDLDKAEKIKKDLQKKEDFLLFQIKKDTGVDVDIWAAVSVAKAFDKLDIRYERTESLINLSLIRTFCQRINIH